MFYVKENWKVVSSIYGNLEKTVDQMQPCNDLNKKGLTTKSPNKMEIFAKRLNKF